MGGGHIRYSRTVQYGTLRMYAEEPPVRDAPGRYSPLPESFISDPTGDTNNFITRWSRIEKWYSTVREYRTRIRRLRAV